MTTMELKTPAAATPPADPREAMHRSGRWSRFAWRGVKVFCTAFFIAGCLWALFNNPFATGLVYSLCISLSIWLCIDLGRDAVAAFTSHRLFGSDSRRGAWPGWVWMLAVVVVGAVLGYAIGNEIANWITGHRSPGPFNAGLRETVALLVMSVVPAAMITYYFQSREVISLQQAEVERAQRQATEQQLKLLESQLEPHMLFNTLANLRVLIALDPPRAQAMLDQLISFLRSSLNGSRVRLHPLGDEFQGRQHAQDEEARVRGEPRRDAPDVREQPGVGQPGDLGAEPQQQGGGEGRQERPGGEDPDRAESLDQERQAHG